MQGHKLLLETPLLETQLVVEASKEEGVPKKLFIEGIFAQAAIQNRNGRVYPESVLETAVEEYKRDFISRNRATGELGHPPTTSINEERVSHIITEMHKDGNNYIGRARILTSMPMGRLAANLLEEGVQLGVSTRALGRLVQNKQGIKEVQQGLKMVTVDIVSDPSGPACFVDAIHEATEYFFDTATGNWIPEKAIEEVRESIQRKDDAAAIMAAFRRFVNTL